MKDFLNVKRGQMELARNGLFHFIRQKVHEIDSAPAGDKEKLAGELIDRVIEFSKSVDAIQSDLLMFDYMNKRLDEDNRKKPIDIFDILRKTLEE